MLTQERINLNFSVWVEKLKKYDCFSQTMIDELGDKLRNASYGLQEDCGAAYQGAMLHVVLNNLCVMAYHINEFAFGKNEKGQYRHEALNVNYHMLMRVLLLQHISKAEMFVLQSNQWKAKNGYIYEFNPDIHTCMKCGERSIYLCMKYGISLSEEEFEAMRVIDRDDDKSNPFYSPLCQLVKIANQMTNVELRCMFEKQKNINEEKIED